MQSGQSIAQVASAHGVSTQKVIDAIVAVRTSDLAAAVKSGQLTQAQADQLAARTCSSLYTGTTMSTSGLLFSFMASESIPKMERT